MTVLLCRNRVRDFNEWKSIFESHATAHKEAGLHLKSLWRSLDDPENVFFLFDVNDISKARAFIHNPAASKAGDESGVIDSEYHFLAQGKTYGA